MEERGERRERERGRKATGIYPILLSSGQREEFLALGVVSACLATDAIMLLLCGPWSLG